MYGRKQMRRLVALLILITCFMSSGGAENNLTIAEVPVEVPITTDDDSEQELSSQLQEVDGRSGGWSSWSEWSACSRSCDGGVSHQLRTCKPGSCRGDHVRYKICNMQSCPEAHEFREVQCSAYNSIPYQGNLYEWSAHYNDSNPCALTCKGKPISESSNEDPVLVVVKLADKVHDGTRCRLGSLDMCIDGECQRVGCDLRIGSTRQVDECGVCGGDGSSCSRPLYHWTLTYMSLCSVTCGGGYKMSRPLCQNRVTGEEVEEELCNESQKPDSTIVECNTHNCPPKWHMGEWGPCSVSCGGGSRLRQVYCVEEANSTKIRVNDQKCTGHKPWFQEACNRMDCPAWIASSWSGCSVSCGEGTQVRVVECRDSADKPSTLCPQKLKPIDSKPCSTGIQCPHHIDASEEFLPGLYHTQPLVQPYPPPPPAHAERLVGEQVVPSESTFVPDEWGPCSVTCGEGVRKRQVHCKIFLEFSRTIAKLPDKQCTGPKPIETEKCYMEPCSAERIGVDIKDDPYRSDIKVAGGFPGKSYSWKEQGYTHCSATCLGGVQELIVNCVRDDTQKVTSPYLCPIELKPEILMRTCNDHPCPPRWNYSDFSTCSQSCGIGIQTREVNCIHEVTQGGGNTVIVPNNMCPQPPPPDRQYCNVLDCPVRWKVSEWSRCSKPCGGGEKIRKVECKQVMAQNHTVDRSPELCPSPKPPDRKPCNTKSCIIESDKPHIDVSNSSFIQHDFKKKKIALKVGGSATVFIGTTVKIKCPVKRFNRTKIQWVKDKNFLPKSKKYKTSKKGALRVQNLTLRDSGRYTCVAGRSSASIQISVRPKPGEFLTSEEIQKQGKPDRSELISDVYVNREDTSPIFSSDDHSHEQRPDVVRKKPTPKTRILAPTLPALNSNNLNAYLPQSTTLHPDNVHDEVLPTLSPASSSESLKPFYENSASSAGRIMPHFQRLLTNLQQLWPFQTFSNSRGHRMVAFPEESFQENSFAPPTTEDEFGSVVVLGKGTPENLKFEWVISDWSKCSQTCGGNGFQMRAIRCIVRLHNTTHGVDHNFCEDAGMPIPATERKCGLNDCPRWVTSEWTPCDKSKCFDWHTAMQRRLVKCQIEGNVTVAESKCNEEDKPTHRQECANERCVGKWKLGAWSECSADCEMQGFKYRILQCVWYGTKKPAGTACKDLPRPPVMKTCKGPPCSKSESQCKDHSMFCSNVKTMNMCKITRYQQQCCKTCKAG
ncbi:protein madd-4 isoform X3 [Tribolium castaneum]|uniref:protein madd-4 isoform X3 n=1 Tax=Tribolium castaneum TaxID=7070 RepID=UPI000175861F|nr:PREDICTED: ADAMTS-like protein 1 isoform X2 [Tribolium castaneum]|eukprot:XP_015837335.1 PREDICTED: ADAMTS-like protein 1 isoform X2 [Tribolium castaneum]